MCLAILKLVFMSYQSQAISIYDHMDTFSVVIICRKIVTYVPKHTMSAAYSARIPSLLLRRCSWNLPVAGSLKTTATHFPPLGLTSQILICKEKWTRWWGPWRRSKSEMILCFTVALYDQRVLVNVALPHYVTYIHIYIYIYVNQKFLTI